MGRRGARILVTPVFAPGHGQLDTRCHILFNYRIIGEFLGSARGSRVGDGGLAVTNFLILIGARQWEEAKQETIAAGNVKFVFSCLPGFLIYSFQQWNKNPSSRATEARACAAG